MKVTYDITHFIGNLLKRKYLKEDLFSEIKKKISNVRKQILQTPFCFLLPPKEQTKAKFLNLPRFSKWFKFILTYLDSHKDQKAHEYFGWLVDQKDWITGFCLEIDTLFKIQGLFKNNGVSDEFGDELLLLIHQINDRNIRKSLIDYIEIELKFAFDNNIRSLATTDIIESIFGRYKEAIKNHSMSEINRSVLSIPCICSNIDSKIIAEVAENISHRNLNEWTKKEIGETQFSKRIKLRKKKTSHGAGSLKDADTPPVELVVASG